MKKVFFNLTLIMILGLLLLPLAACNFEEVKADDNTYYIDDFAYENDAFRLVLTSNSCYGTKDYTLDVDIKVTNLTLETKSYAIKNVYIKKGLGKYDVEYLKSIYIEAGLSKGLGFKARIPSSIEKDKYTLYFEINQVKFKLDLYEKPDELRETRTVEFYIGNEKVHTSTVKDRRHIDYLYETEDNLAYNDTWYKDENKRILFNTYDVIEEDTILYGYLLNNLSIIYFASDPVAYLLNVNHIPSNKTLIIPSNYMNKTLQISKNAIKDIEVNEIYVPSSVCLIESGNFKNIGEAKIYFEGTKEEWISLFKDSNDVVLENVEFNKKYE